MKRLFLFTIATTVALSTFAQNKGISLKRTFVPQSLASRTTAVGDTATVMNFGAADTLAIYTLANPDSGYVFGTNALGDKGYAERYVTTSDVQILGVIADFTGHVSPTSTKNVVFNAWTVAAASATGVSGHLFHSGYPGTSLGSVTAPVTDLGISVLGDGDDTITYHAFPAPTAATHKFFVGYTITYDPAAFGGDTIGLVSTRDGDRDLAAQPISYVTGADTFFNDVNTTLWVDNSWHNNATTHFTIWNNLAIFPRVIIGNVSGVGSVTKNNFTLFANYPNPATNETNIKFAVANSTTVTIVVYNVAGQVIRNINEHFTAGTHIVPVNTADLATGEYVYLVRTAEGEGIASQFTVAK